MGDNAVAYHAQLGNDERSSNLKCWMAGPVNIVVATSALGIGIDVPNVRLVVHVCEPHTLIDYVQQTGRGGRDGKPTQCVMLLPVKSRYLNEKSCLRRQLIDYLDGFCDMSKCLAPKNLCGPCSSGIATMNPFYAAQVFDLH